jgi:hypothetical protein
MSLVIIYSPLDMLGCARARQDKQFMNAIKGDPYIIFQAIITKIEVAL